MNDFQNSQQTNSVIVIPTSETRLEELIEKAVTKCLKNTPFPNNTTQDEDEIGGIELAKRLTGLAYATIRTKASRNEIPFSKPAGTKHLRFKKSELLKWMSEGRRKTVSEIAAEAENFQPKTKQKGKK